MLSNSLYQGPYTSTATMQPYLTAIPQAEQYLLNANQLAEQKALEGLGQQASQVSTGNVNAQNLYNPYIQTGTEALDTASGVAGRFTPEQYDQALQNPQFQAILRQGISALDKSAAGKGNLFSGGQMLGINQLAQDLASGYLDKIYNQNLQLATLGSQNTGQAAQAALGTGQALGAVEANKGLIGSNAAIAGGNIQAGARLREAEAKAAGAAITGIPQGSVINPGLAQFNPNINPDPWGNAAAMNTPKPTTPTTSGGGGGSSPLTGISSPPLTPMQSASSDNPTNTQASLMQIGSAAVGSGAQAALQAAGINPTTLSSMVSAAKESIPGGSQAADALEAGLRNLEALQKSIDEANAMGRDGESIYASVKANLMRAIQSGQTAVQNQLNNVSPGWSPAGSSVSNALSAGLASVPV